MLLRRSRVMLGACRAYAYVRASPTGSQATRREEGRDGGQVPMKRSTQRFLTTHTGSLPRPEDLVRMMYAKEEGVPVEPAALAERVALAVEEVVRKQAE